MRSTLAHLTKSKAALAVMVAAVLMAVAATGAGYAAMSKTVNLSVDGKSEEVRVLGIRGGEARLGEAHAGGEAATARWRSGE